MIYRGFVFAMGVCYFIIYTTFKYDMLLMGLCWYFQLADSRVLFWTDVMLKGIARPMFKDLDPILHSQLRLAVMSLLISVKEAEFTFIREKTNATAGNLSVQIQKLKDAGYIDVTKQFKDNYPLTICKITKQGIKAFEDYVTSLQSYLGK